MALHFLTIFEHHEVFLSVITTNAGCCLLFSNFCATVILLGLCQKVECQKVIGVTTIYFFKPYIIHENTDEQKLGNITTEMMSPHCAFPPYVSSAHFSIATIYAFSREIRNCFLLLFHIQVKCKFLANIRGRKGCQLW